MQERVERYYDANAAYEWNRLERHRIEFALTMRALGRHLTEPGRILDVGGGPGRYAIALAQQGHRVTLLDLSAGNLAFAREKAAELGAELEGIVHGNALDLSRFEAASFDVVLRTGARRRLHRPLLHAPRRADPLYGVLRPDHPGGAGAGGAALPDRGEGEPADRARLGGLGRPERAGGGRPVDLGAVRPPALPGEAAAARSSGTGGVPWSERR